MKINKYIILSLTVVAALAMTSCFEEQDLNGILVDPEFHLTVLDVDGNPISGATVTLFANKDDYLKFINVLATAPTDANGVAIFAKGDLGTASLFHYSVSAGDNRNWDGSFKKAINVTNGITQLTTTVNEVTLSTAISGDTQVISSTSGSFSIKAYPGKYEWSIISGPSGTIDDPNNTSVSIAFEQRDTDAAVTVQVVATPDGFPTTTLTFDFTVLAFCEYDHTKLNGDRPGGDITVTRLGWPPFPSQVSIQPTNTPDEFEISGLGAGWMEDFWGETIQNPDVSVNMSLSSDGLFITIPAQEYFLTDYNGDLYQYGIVGSGQINGCTGEMNIQYDMYYTEDGWSTATWSYEAEYTSYPLFQANLTFTP
jgi:hypothetical protein